MPAEGLCPIRDPSQSGGVCGVDQASDIQRPLKGPFPLDDDVAAWTTMATLLAAQDARRQGGIADRPRFGSKVWPGGQADIAAARALDPELAQTPAS